MTTLTLSQKGMTPWQLDQLATSWLIENDPAGHWKARQYRETHKCHQSLPDQFEEAFASKDALDQPDTTFDLACGIDETEQENLGFLGELQYQNLRDNLIRAMQSARFTPGQIRVWEAVLGGLNQDTAARYLGVTKQYVSDTICETRRRVAFLAKIVISKASADRSPTQPMLPTSSAPLPGAGQQLALFSDDDFGGAE